MVYSCYHRGHKEKCVMRNGFPVTKNGKLNCARVRNAIARASQFGHLSAIKKGGIRRFVKRCHIKSHVI